MVHRINSHEPTPLMKHEEASANLSTPGIIAAKTVKDLPAALEQFAEIEADLKE